MWIQLPHCQAIKTRHSRKKLLVVMLIYIADYGLWYGLGLGFLSFTEIGSRDLSPSLWNVNMFCIVQCSHQVWNMSPSPYPSLSPEM